MTRFEPCVGQCYCRVRRDGTGVELLRKIERLLGGAETIRQYLQAGLVDEMHVAVSPILLGSGEHLLAGLDLRALGYRCTECVPSAKAAHYIIGRA